MPSFRFPKDICTLICCWLRFHVLVSVRQLPTDYCFLQFLYIKMHTLTNKKVAIEYYKLLQYPFNFLLKESLIKVQHSLHRGCDICFTYKITNKLKPDARADAERTSDFRSSLGSHFPHCHFSLYAHLCQTNLV